MANMVTSRLRITSDLSWESRKELSRLFHKAQSLYVLSGESSGGDPRYRTVEVEGKAVHLLSEMLGMGNFLNKPDWVLKRDQHNVVYPQPNKEQAQEAKRYDDWYAEHTGGPRHIYDSEITELRTSRQPESKVPDVVEYHFETKWGSVVPFVQLLSETYPTLTFDYTFSEELGEFSGRIVVKNEATLLHEEYSSGVSEPKHHIEINSAVVYAEFIGGMQTSRGKIRNSSTIDLPEPGEIAWERKDRTVPSFSASLETAEVSVREGRKITVLPDPQLKSIRFFRTDGQPTERSFELMDRDERSVVDWWNRQFVVGEF